MPNTIEFACFYAETPTVGVFEAICSFIFCPK